MGIAAPQARGGMAVQKRVAYIAAQRELAANIRVLVSTEVTTEKLNIDTATVRYYESRLSTLSRHQAEEFLKDYQTLDEWIDPKTKEYYIWLVLRK